MENAIPLRSPRAATPRRARTTEERALRADLRRQLVRSNAFEFVVATFSILAAPIIGLSSHGLAGSAVGHMTASLAPCWFALFVAGGVLMALGMLILSPRVEIAGLLFFIAAMVTDGVAVLAYSGGSGAAGAMTFLALALASGWRVHVVLGVVAAATHRTGEYVR